MSIRVFSVFLALILFSAPFIQVARCQSDPETDVVEGTGEAGDLGIVDEDVRDFGSDSFSPAPGIETPGSFDLVGIIVYEIDQNPFQSTFYNGTIEVTEPGGLLSVESVFLFCLGIALLALLGFWIRGQIQNLSKKTKRAPKAKVEVGTATTDASTDEWLEGLVLPSIAGMQMER
uniref:Uncharacterized protein n=1 Tax=Solanum lycopersicum TaxID=4081 RepID=A0A3Q7IHA1_SOLLC